MYVSGSGRTRVTRYCVGVQTNIGDVEISDWIDLMRRLIARLGETELQKQLQQWVKKNYTWLHTRSEIEQKALELHALRAFDWPQWSDYIAFNNFYRPEVLESANLVCVVCSSCGKKKQITREGFQGIQELHGGKKYCHKCADWVSLVLVGSPKEDDR